jgi:polyribonucleotide nucleotidyltransferase
MTAEAQVGQVYTGKVVSITDFGAFIEILPGQDGLCHVSELSAEYVKNVEDVVKLGDTLEVKVINIDDNGRIKLSHKVLMKPSEGSQQGGQGRPPSREGGERPGGERRGHGGGGGRGGRGGGGGRGGRDR